MKKISVILAFVLLITVFASCKRGKIDSNAVNNTSSSQSEQSGSTQPASTVQAAVPKTTDKKENSTEPQRAQSAGTTAPVQTEQTQEQKAVTYISENPDNYYIVKVSEKYGSDPQNLIAFITKNSSAPGATVLEFSGKRDSGGNLITTEEELKYLCYVSDSGDIKRASSDGQHNDGYNYIAAKAAIMLGQKYYIPSIPEMREQRRYEDYF